MKALYAARIQDLRPRDFVKVKCAAFGQVSAGSRVSKHGV
jgi:hypothetical protein